jgi:nitric oxide dioxygenase
MRRFPRRGAPPLNFPRDTTDTGDAGSATAGTGAGRAASGRDDDDGGGGRALLDPKSIGLLKASFAVLAPRADELAERFYAELAQLAPEVLPLFPAELGSRRRHLAAALAMVMKHIDHLAPIRRGLRRAAAAPQAHEPVVAAALVQAMAGIAGPAWTPRHAEAWTVALGAVAGLLLDAAGLRPARQVA